MLKSIFIFLFFSSVTFGHTDSPNPNICPIEDDSFLNEIFGSGCLAKLDLTGLSDQPTAQQRFLLIDSKVKETCDCVANPVEDTNTLNALLGRVQNQLSSEQVHERLDEENCNRARVRAIDLASDFAFIFNGSTATDRAKFLGQVLEGSTSSDGKVSQHEAIHAASSGEEQADSHACAIFPISPQEITQEFTDESSPENCISRNRFNGFRKVPQYNDIFRFFRENESTNPAQWSYTAIKRELSELSRNVAITPPNYNIIYDPASQTTLGGYKDLGQAEQARIRQLTEQLRFLNANPALKFFFNDGDTKDAEAEKRRGLLTQLRNHFNSNTSSRCHRNSNPHTCKDEYLGRSSLGEMIEILQGTMGNEALVTKLIDASDEAIEQEAQSDPNNELYNYYSRVNFSAETCSDLTTPGGIEQCTNQVGLACLLKKEIPPNHFRTELQNLPSPLVIALENSNTDLNHFNRQICQRSRPHPKTGILENFSDFDRRTCGVPRRANCPNISVNVARYLEEYAPNENPDLIQYLKNSDGFSLSANEVDIVVRTSRNSGGSRVRDALGNFNVDLPGSSDSRSRSISRGESAQPIEAPSQSGEPQNFSFSPAQSPFMASPAAMSVPGLFPSNPIDETSELSEARLERDQQEAKLTDKEAEYARARQEGASEERLRQTERQITELRTALAESGQKYQQLLQDLAKKSEEPARSTAERNEAAPVENQASPVRAPAAVTSATQAFASAGRPSALDAPLSQATNVGSTVVPFSSGGVSGAGSGSASASAASAQNYNSALNDKYLGNGSRGEASLRVTTAQTTGARIEIPVSSEVYGLVMGGNYEALTDSVRRQIGQASSDQPVFIEIQSTANSRQTTELVALREGSGFQFLTVEQYNEIQGRTLRAPAAVVPSADCLNAQRLSELQGLFGNAAPSPDCNQ